MTASLLAELAPRADASRPAGDHFAGVEYFGSSQLTRLELVKLLGLKEGASAQATERAVKKVERQLESRHLRANFQMVSVPPDQIFVVVDVLDSQTEPQPTRRLKSPRHVLLSSDRPLELLGLLHARLDKLQAEGRPSSESVEEGIKHYSDEPAEQLAAEIRKFPPEMRHELLAVVDSDPDPSRRVAAIELLNFWGGVPDTAQRLLPALDDSEEQVRIAVDRYLFPRMNMLGEYFPYHLLVAGLSHQIRRHSHEDRAKGLYTLLALARVQPLHLREIKAEDEAVLKQLLAESVLPTIKEPCQQLLSAIAEWNKGPLPKQQSQANEESQGRGVLPAEQDQDRGAANR